MRVAEITVCKASPTGLAYPTPDYHIHVSAELPEFPFDTHDPHALSAHLRVANAYFEEQAQQIEESLWASLPGGTYDRLLGRMLARKASHYRVAHGEPSS